jgi:hypothetical protein
MLHPNQKNNKCSLLSCLSENCFENAFTFFMLTWGLVCLGIGIYAAVQLTNLADRQEIRDHDSDGIWKFNIGACCADFFWAFCIVVGLRSFVNDDGRNFIIIPGLFLEMVLTGWAIYVYHYNRDNLYLQFWNQVAPGLLVQVYAHYAYLGVFAVLLGFMGIGSCYGQRMAEKRYNK